MLSKFSIKLFKIQLALSSKIFAVPYERQRGRIEVCSEKNRKFLFRLRLLTMLYLILLVLNSINTLLVNNMFRAFPTAVGVMWVTIAIGAFHFFVLSKKKEQEIMTLLNSVLKLTADSKIPNERQKFHIIEYILGLGLVISVSFGPFVGSLLCVIPCLPPFLGSLALECDPNGFASEQKIGFQATLTVIIFQALLNTILWTYIIVMCVFYMFYVFPMSVVSITGHLNIMKRLSRDTRNISDVEKVYQMYRESQVLTTMMNDCYQAEWLPMTAAVESVVEIISLYVCIAKWDELPTFAFLFFPLAMADAVTLLFGMLGLASQVLIKSQEVKRSLKDFCWQNRLYKRLLISCPRLKVGFGTSNFVDETTPLVLNRFCIIQAASIILLDR